VVRQWPAILERITRRRISLGNFLAAAVIARYQNNVITLAFSPQQEFHKQQAEKKENMQLIQEVFSASLGRPTRVACLIMEAPPAESPAPLMPKEPLPEVNAHTIARRDPAVKRLLDAFDGQIVGG
jgi:hypothetical protein